MMKRGGSLRICAVAATVIILAATTVWGWLQWRQAKLQSSLMVVLYDTTGLRTGDLVFRNGLGNESLLVTSTSKGEYSHVGIAVATATGWQVVHAVPGEAAPDVPDYLKCEPIDSFFEPHRAMAGAMARVDCDDATAAAAAEAAMHKVMEKVEFDHKYNLDDTTQLYCTELVKLAYSKQGIDLSEDRYAPTPGIGESGRIIYPEHLWVSPRLVTKKTFKTTLYTNQ